MEKLATGQETTFFTQKRAISADPVGKPTIVIWRGQHVECRHYDPF